MSKNRKRNKPDLNKPEPGVVLGIHRPKQQRAHLAHEYRDRGFLDFAEEVTRALMPHLRGRAQGIGDHAYTHRGFRTTSRRDILGGTDG